MGLNCTSLYIWDIHPNLYMLLSSQDSSLDTQSVVFVVISMVALFKIVEAVVLCTGIAQPDDTVILRALLHPPVDTLPHLQSSSPFLVLQR